VSEGPDPRSIDDLVFRSLTDAEDLAAFPRFEERIWGSGFDLVSVNMLVATVAEGGVAIGAYDGADLVGMVYGFPTRTVGLLHSHYLAVDPAWRRSGLGVELKQRQRMWCLDHGYMAMRWTYDPLQLANAHLNLRVLGGVGESYHPNYYGVLDGINGTLPTDRVVVRWSFGPEVPARPVAELIVDVPPATPADIAASNATARHARETLRAALLPRLGDGWVLVDVDRDERRYHLGRKSDAALHR
jgi:predicted GNAT superfamily acetyltransferase